MRFLFFSIVSIAVAGVVSPRYVELVGKHEGAKSFKERLAEYEANAKSPSNPVTSKSKAVVDNNPPIKQREEDFLKLWKKDDNTNGKVEPTKRSAHLQKRSKHTDNDMPVAVPIMEEIALRDSADKQGAILQSIPRGNGANLHSSAKVPRIMSQTPVVSDRELIADPKVLMLYEAMVKRRMKDARMAADLFENMKRAALQMEKDEDIIAYVRNRVKEILTGVEERRIKAVQYDDSLDGAVMRKLFRVAGAPTRGAAAVRRRPLKFKRLRNERRKY